MRIVSQSRGTSAACRREQTQPAAPSGGGARARILVAEDERDLRGVVAEMLEAAGHRVVTAANGAEALQILLACDAAGFGLLFTDLMMPVMDGFELARNAAVRWPWLPILYASGYAPDALVESASIVPAPLLAKPFRLRALLTAVEACLSGSGARSAAG
jgi:CheY-like chemotaxis protein